MGNRNDTLVRALAFHQGVRGSILGPGVICGLSLLLVLFLAPRGFSPGTPVFSSPQKPTFPNSNSILECTDISERVLWTPWCSVGKQITFFFGITVSARVLALWFSGCKNFGFAACAGRCCSAQEVRELAFEWSAVNLDCVEQIFILKLG